MLSTRLLPRSERPGGRSVEVTAQFGTGSQPLDAQHPSRSTACLTTLHEPCLSSPPDHYTSLPVWTALTASGVIRSFPPATQRLRSRRQNSVHGRQRSPSS